MDYINNRYRIEKKLEVDSESRYFLVTDTREDQKKILRLFNKGASVKDNAELFENFLTYTRAEHKNILSNYNFDVLNRSSNKKSDLQYFYTKEYLDPDSLLSYTDLNERERHFVLESVLYALTYLHFKGIVYGNLSFSNVFIYRNKERGLQVKLDDLASVALERNTNRALKKESIFYVTGIETYQLTTQVDLFSLGMMTYYLLTGKDYHKESIDYRGMQEIPEQMAQLISNSIHINPSKRPKTVLEFWKVASDCLGIRMDFVDRTYYEYLDFSSSFVVHKEKRDIILEQIRAYFAGEETRNVMFVRSRRGMGKSRVLSEIKHFSNLKGYNPLMIEASDLFNGEYPNFKRLLVQLLEQFEIPSGLLEKYGKDLLYLVPEYQRKWNVQPSIILEKTELRNRIVSRYLSFIEKMASEYRFMIIIDNADKLTKGELYILSSLIKSDSERLPYLLLSARDMPAGMSEWNKLPNYNSIELKPFNYHDTVYYIKKLFNIGDEAKAIAKSISGICHGNPRKIENIILFMYKIGRIRMSEERIWNIQDSDFDLKEEELEGVELYDVNPKAFYEAVSKLSEDAVFVLKQLSVFSQQIDVFFALQFSSLGGKRFMNAVDELINADIVHKIVSDWGNYYEIVDYRLSNLFYNQIDPAERVALHRDIAAYYEDKDFDVYESEFDSYILHLIRSNQRELAVESLKSKAEKKIQKYLFKEAIEYYEYALSIIDNKESSGYLSIIESISDVYHRLGKLKDAENYYFKLIEVSDELDYQDIKLTTYQKVLELFIFQNRIAEAKEIVEEIREELEDYPNESIRIRFEYYLMKLAYKDGDLERFLSICDELVPYLKLISNEYYLAHVLLEKAIYFIDRFEYDEATVHVQNSLEILERHRVEKKELIRPNKLLGLIAFKGHDYVSSERYFQRAYEIADEVGHLWQNSKLLIDMGNLYIFKYDYDKAQDFFQRAEKSASLSNQLDAIMLSSLSLIKVNLLLEDYATAKMQYDKYADLFEEQKSSNLRYYYYLYLLISAKMFLELKVYKHAENLIRKIEEGGLPYLESLQILQVKLLRNDINYFKSVLYEEIFRFDELEEIMLRIKGRREIHLINDYLLDLALDAYLNERYDIFTFAYEKSLMYETPDPDVSLVYRFEFCHDLMNHDEEKLFSYIGQINYKQFTYAWKILCILADIQFEKGKYVDALANYIESRGLFLDRMHSVPISYRDDRMQIDTSLIKICERIQRLAGKLYGIHVEVENMVRDIDLETNSRQEKLMKRLIAKIISDKEYKKYHKRVYENKFLFYIDNWQKYISDMDEDSRLNLEKLIKFLTEYSMAEYGCFIVTGPAGEILDVLSTDYNYDPGVLDYIYSKDEKRDFYLENKTWELTLSLYSGSDSTRMFFPVYLKEKTNLYNRRSYDEGKYRELMGYVYLESKKVIHNITQTLYKKIIAYEPLIALVANEYVINKKVSLDNLTQTHLRAYVQEAVEKTIEKSFDTNLQFSVLMIDIDHFKDVNDRYGHTRGDEVLRGLAGILQQNVRESDIVGRYGGEEFIVILNGLSKGVVKEVADKIRVAVDKAKLLGDDRPVTISIGAASFPEHGRNLDQLIENADRALYYSKNNGRNMVSVYDSSMAKHTMRNDALAGVFGISQFEDHRRMNAIIEIMNGIVQKSSNERILKEILSIVLDIVEAKEVSVVLSDGRVFSNRSNLEGLEDRSLLSSDKLADVVRHEDGFYTDWKEDFYDSEGIKIANWNNYILSSLQFKGVKYGKIILFSTIKEHEFELHHYKFVSNISGLVASVVKDIVK
ncbi:MAG: diguanylate cyclase [Bacillota bacterium]|nr:diguanylate cyclase [Bacillota bacterium]